MKQTLVKLLFVASAIATIIFVAFPALNSDGGKVKDKVTEEYTQIFR